MTEPRQPEEHPTPEQKPDTVPHGHARHGIPKGQENQGEPKGRPSSDREATETAASKQS